MNGNLRSPSLAKSLPDSLYSLEKLVEWKPKRLLNASLSTFDAALYSLEKLVEWKLDLWIKNNSPWQELLTLYSLEKLVEWKRVALAKEAGSGLTSLLAREIS